MDTLALNAGHYKIAVRKEIVEAAEETQAVREAICGVDSKVIDIAEVIERGVIVAIVSSAARAEFVSETYR